MHPNHNMLNSRERCLHTVTIGTQMFRPPLCCTSSKCRALITCFPQLPSLSTSLGIRRAEKPTMAAQSVAFSSVVASRAFLSSARQPVQRARGGSLQATNFPGCKLIARRSLTRSFWCSTFFSQFRCGDLLGIRESSSMESGSSSSGFRAGPTPAGRVDERPRRQYNFDTIVLEPTDQHLATVVWLHGFSDSGARWAQELKNVNQLSPNIKWIIPTAPLARDLPVTAWFEFRMGQDVDLEGLDKSAELVVNLLLNDLKRDGDSKNLKLAVGGFSQGCATSLYIMACSVIGKYSNGKPFPIKFDAAIGLSGWMPTIKNLVAQMTGNQDARSRAAKTSIFLGHCEDDGVVPAGLAKASSGAFSGVGFADVTLKTYPQGGHSATQQEIADISEWITSKLKLERPQRQG